MSATVAHEQQHAQRQHQPQQPQASASVTGSGSGSSSAPSSPTRPRSVSVKHVRVEADETRSQLQLAQHTRAHAPAPAATATNTNSKNNSNSGAHANVTAPKSRVSHINVGDERLHLALIQLLGCVLAQLVAFEEQQYPSGRGSISMFHTAYVPSISIGAYLRRVALYTKVSSEVLLQSVLHVHQLMQREVQPLIVNSLNVHRLLLTSILTTAKFFDDAHYNNAYFSYVGGVPLRELNALEVEFLSLLNFDFFVHSSTYAFFYNMCRERSIHGGGCACPAVMDHVPETIALAEYRPDPDVDFSVPAEAANEAANSAAATAEPVQQLGSGSMRALNEAIRTLASEHAKGTPNTARLDESVGSTDTDSEELSSASALATPAQQQQQHRSHSRAQSHVSVSASSSSGATTKTPRQQQLHVQHFAPNAPQHQHHRHQQRSSSPASCASSCFPSADSPVSTSSSSLSSLASYTHHSRAHTSHAVPSSGVLAQMQSPSMSRSCSTSVSASVAPSSHRHGRGTGTVTAAATPLAADSMQHTPRMCVADTPTTSMMDEDGDAVLKDKHARLGLGPSLTPRMSVVPQEQ